MKRRVLLLLAGAAAGIAVATVQPVSGMDSGVGIEAGECQWYAAVRVGTSCTGAYVGNGIVLTAAHCFYAENCVNQQPVFDGAPGFVKFGEDEDDPALQLDVTGGDIHPNGEATCSFGERGYDGVDLAYLELEEIPEDIVGIPPMVPTGCERDWLSKRVRGASPGDQLFLQVGMGCDSVSCTAPGIKRFIGEDFPDHAEDSPRRSAIARFGSDSATGVRGGDSGGPGYIRLPDGTWQLISVVHEGIDGTSDPAVQTVPPYLAWIETASGRDITPCHAIDDAQSGSYVFDWEQGCDTAFPLNPGDPNDTWTNGCATNLDLAGPPQGAVSACAHWPQTPPARFIAPF